MEKSEMTKKNLNKIYAVSYLEFKSQYTDAEFDSIFGGSTIVAIVKLSGIAGKSEIWILNRASQINSNTLVAHGFRGRVHVEWLFRVNRSAKTMIPIHKNDVFDIRAIND